MIVLLCAPSVTRAGYRVSRYLVFVVSFVTLGVLGVMPPTFERTIIAQIATVAYFAFFILMPLYTRFEKTRAVPDRVTGR